MECHISLIAQQLVITRRHTILQHTEKKKLDRSSKDQHLSVLHFYENIRRSNLFVHTTFLKEGVFWTQLYSNAGIPVWRSAWSTAICIFFSDMQVPQTLCYWRETGHKMTFRIISVELGGKLSSILFTKMKIRRDQKHYLLFQLMHTIIKSYEC